MLESESGVVINNLICGNARAVLPSGRTVGLEISEGYPVGGDISVRMSLEQSESFTLKIRVPATASVFKARFKDKVLRSKNGYVTLNCEFSDGDVIEIKIENRLEEIRLNGKTAFKYGALALCRDSAKEEGEVDLTEETVLKRKCGKPIYTLLKAQEGETVRVAILKKDGTELVLTDYASCGKMWNGEKARITVWQNIK